MILIHVWHVLCISQLCVTSSAWGQWSTYALGDLQVSADKALLQNLKITYTMHAAFYWMRVCNLQHCGFLRLVLTCLSQPDVAPLWLERIRQQPAMCGSLCFIMSSSTNGQGCLLMVLSTNSHKKGLKEIKQQFVFSPP